MPFKSFVLVLSLLALSTFNLHSAKIKDSSLIVHLMRSATDKDLGVFETAGFHLTESLNLEKTYYKLTFNAAWMSLDEAIEKCQSMDFVDVVQEDFRVELRSTTPNDPNFVNQWHLQLIKADMAWDFERSGLNKRGDTIVIAVVDDGLHINHPDFQGNIWINYADTIDNGMDDDGNGYIDDTYGWNFQSNNKDISDSGYYKAKHGTPVAGIIGANTNNGIGISGIMWKVKLMFVNIADTGDFPETFQSDVIKAYSYVLHQRKLYNSSNGQLGAYVVAQNSSWGADNKRPNQAPIWCSFYDTLGKYGIFSVAATTNGQKNIEASGDMPTLCPSDQLVMVGASTAADNYGGCGYSTISVDLSAPGYNIFTAAPYIKENIQTNNIYRSGYSGTSFSAPMVTAAIGLLHTVACQRVLDTMKMNPAKGNLILRKVLLEGVDQVPGLIGKSVTGGRLNILKSIQILNAYCAGEVNNESIVNSENIQVFPNPFSSGELNITSTSEVVSVELVNVLGQTKTLEYANGSIKNITLNEGVYYLRIRTEKGVSLVKLVCRN